jgi:rhodanese-related sulfurtransferase/polyisoprenoid-binding protein YceI
MEKMPIREIPPEELHRQASGKPGSLLIDILPPEHFSRRHLPGASNACVYEVTFLQQVEALAADRSVPIVLYGSCSASHEAAVAADKLARAGYGDVALLKGGLDGWRTAGLPLEGEAGGQLEDPGTTYRPADGSYPVDVEKSIIEWTGRNPNGRHFGTVRLAAGTISTAAGRVAGEFTIDMRSIANVDLAGNELQPVLIAHLNSDDFFFTRLFPTAKFTLRGVRMAADPYVGAPNGTVDGTFELRGVSADLSFPVTVAPTPEGGLSAEAHFDIDRTRWNVIYGSAHFFEHLGIHLVFDLISLQVRIVTG